MRSFKTLAAALGLVLALSGLIGCEGNKLIEENGKLSVQNKELQSELDKERAARDAQENELARLKAERDAKAREAAAAAAAEANRKPAPAPAPMPAPMPAAAPSAGNPADFMGIPGVEAEKRGKDISVKISDDVLFQPGKATLTEQARKTLSAVVKVLKTEYAGKKLQIEGHTDTDPIRHSKWASNQQLSEARAKAVMSYLAQQGITASQMTAIGYGESQPKETKAKSRRVEIVVIQ